MILRNAELFRSWLIRQLEPICKANPEPVSKYVCALLKKEKNDGELKNNLISQLYIFLHSATEEFVNFLIDALENDKYLNENLPKCTEEVKPFNESDVIVQIKMKDTSKKNEIESTSIDEPKRGKKSQSPSRITISLQKSPTRSKRNRFRNERKRTIGGVARRSRRDSSHSNSPPVNNRRVAYRKRSASGSSGSSNKSPRRSWITSRSSDAKRYRNRNLGRSPAPRSKTPSPKSRKRKYNNDNFRKRVRNEPSSYCDRERAIGHIKTNNDLPKKEELPDLPISTDRSTDGNFSSKQICIDFESKGYCARGDMCPFDHGPAPIVLDNSLLNGIVSIPPVHTGFPNLAYPPPFPHTAFVPAKNFKHENNLSVDNRGLIPVRSGIISFKNKNLNTGKPNHSHIFSSLPPGISQTSIELTRVPADINKIPDLYEKFSCFGTLTLIQAKRNGNSNTALLTYSNASEAALAFVNCRRVVPNIKVAWYADKCVLKSFPRKSPTSGIQNNNTNKSFAFKKGISPAAVTHKSGILNEDELTSKKVSSVPLNTKPTLTEKKKIEVRKQDSGKLLSVLIKKKRELLEKQLESKKQILKKIESLESGSTEEKTWQDVLKKLNDVISENENSIKESLLQRKEYLQKMNIVPTDSSSLNVMKKDQEITPKNGSPTRFVSSEGECYYNSVLQDGSNAPCSKIVNQDQMNGNSFEVISSNQKGEKDGETQFNPNSEYTTIDVSGFENGDEGELVEHFSRFGQIVDKEFDNTIPSAKFVYDNRKSAEVAKKDGRNFQDRLLLVTIHINKKCMLTSKKASTFRGQEYSTFTHYVSGNPYKYKNPLLVSQSAMKHTPVTNRSLFSYRANQKNRTPIKSENATETEPVVDNSNVKLTEEEDLVTFLQKGGIDVKEVEKYID